MGHNQQGSRSAAFKKVSSQTRSISLSCFQYELNELNLNPPQLHDINSTSTLKRIYFSCKKKSFSEVKFKKFFYYVGPDFCIP